MRQSEELQPVFETEEITFASADLNLHGFIHKPEGNGPFPAILLNHGSEHPKSGKLIANPYVSRGYVIFFPHRRGQGRSSDQGDYIMDLIRQEPESNRGRRFVELQNTHQEDVIAALSYLKQLPYVDVNRITMVGCSFGGIQTVLATEKDLGLRGSVAFSPAAMSWPKVPELRSRLIQAAHSATVPILLIQAKNDYDLSATRIIAKELKERNKPHTLRIFPRFGKTQADGHSFCARGEQVWGNEVFSFLESVAP
ncbi:MAG: dienelactone hydrolase family protein [Cyanobacteria bacterium P01_F01_bin.3]